MQIESEGGMFKKITGVVSGRTIVLHGERYGFLLSYFMKLNDFMDERAICKTSQRFTDCNDAIDLLKKEFKRTIQKWLKITTDDIALVLEETKGEVRLVLNVGGGLEKAADEQLGVISLESMPLGLQNKEASMPMGSRGYYSGPLLSKDSSLKSWTKSIGKNMGRVNP